MHSDVPPSQCDWTFEKTTQRFFSHLSPSSSSLLQGFHSVCVVDIPCHKRKPVTPVPPPTPRRVLLSQKALATPVMDDECAEAVEEKECEKEAEEKTEKEAEKKTEKEAEEKTEKDTEEKTEKEAEENNEREEETHTTLQPTENVFLHQSVLALRSLMAAPPTPLPSSLQLLLQLPFIAAQLTASPLYSPDAVKTALLASLAIPSDSIHTFLATLWRAIAPPPAISFSHPVFRDDFYLRFYNRLRLAESLFVRFVAALYRRSAFRALRPAALRATLRNAHKVMKRELEGCFPCTASLEVRPDSDSSGIARVFDRSAYRNEPQSQPWRRAGRMTRRVWVPCVRPQNQHDCHESAYVADYTWESNTVLSVGRGW